MYPENLPSESFENVLVTKKNPDLQRKMWLTSMDMQTVLDFPKKLTEEEWDSKGRAVGNGTMERVDEITLFGKSTISI